MSGGMKLFTGSPSSALLNALLFCGATSVLFGGTPIFPENDRYWSIMEKYNVNQFYTAPTALRSLMACDNYIIKPHLHSLSVLESVGEPINPEAWNYYKVIGKGRCSIVDTYWQTETGGHVLTPFLGVTPMRPGTAGHPFFGVKPAISNDTVKVIEVPGEGHLCFKRPWPDINRTLIEDQEPFEKRYFSKFPGYYCTGEVARRDEDGYLWVTGLIDDTLNVSGHLMSIAEVEGVLAEHPDVTEAAVVTRPYVPVKCASLYCFVFLSENVKLDDRLKKLSDLVRARIGAFAAPDVRSSTPEGRFGNIMRMILRFRFAYPFAVDLLFNNRLARDT